MTAQPKYEYTYDELQTLRKVFDEKGVREARKLVKDLPDRTLEYQRIVASHDAMKKTSGRGDETPNHLACAAYLKSLERELERVRALLDDAWVTLDGSRDFRKCSVHMDRAQQRLHRAIKKLRGKVKA